jgi:hypothetical protein
MRPVQLGATACGAHSAWISSRGITPPGSRRERSLRQDLVARDAICKKRLQLVMYCTECFVSPRKDWSPTLLDFKSLTPGGCFVLSSFLELLEFRVIGSATVCGRARSAWISSRGTRSVTELSAKARFTSAVRCVIRACLRPDHQQRTETASWTSARSESPLREIDAI